VNSWNVILATIVIFGAGVITGGLLVDHVQHQAPVHHASGPGSKPPVGTNEASEIPGPMRAQILNKQFVQQLNDELQLSEEQRKQIQKIISQGQQNTHDLWKLVGPQFQLIWRDTRVQIRQVLTPEQRKKFEMLMKEQRRQQSTNAPSAQIPGSTNAQPSKLPAITNSPAI
jgi:Spy/CpxP family protein refolding chaperone